MTQSFTIRPPCAINDSSRPTSGYKSGRRSAELTCRFGSRPGSEAPSVWRRTARAPSMMIFGVRVLQLIGKRANRHPSMHDLSAMHPTSPRLPSMAQEHHCMALGSRSFPGFSSCSLGGLNKSDSPPSCTAACLMITAAGRARTCVERSDWREHLKRARSPDCQMRDAVATPRVLLVASSRRP